MAVLSATKLAPYAQQIIHPKWSQEMASRGATEKELTGLVGAQEAQQRGNAEEKRGTYYEGLEGGRQEERRISAEGRRDAARTAAEQHEMDRQQKAFTSLVGGRNPIYRPTGQPGPQGWEPVPMENPALPTGFTAYTPSQLATVPKELLQYMPGNQEGDQVHRDDPRFVNATKMYQLEIEKQNTAKPPPEPKEVSNPAQVLLNPSAYDAATVARAQQMFNQEHRDPNAGAGAISLPPRNPTLPPNARDENVLHGMDPNTAAVIKQLVDYKYPLPTGMALSKPYWQTILGAAAQYDPSFDASQYSVRQKVQSDFGSGKSAQAINSLNTVAQHVDQLEQNWAHLNNSNFMPGIVNPVANAVGSTVGSDLQRRINKFQLDQEAVGNELMRVWRQVGASDSEIKSWQAKLSANLSPAAQQGAIQEIYSLIAGKLSAMKSQYETSMGRPADFHMLTPEVAQRFQKHGVDASDLAPGARYGASAPPVPNGFLRLADGPNGHQIGQKPDGGWYDIQTGQKVQ